MKQLMKRKFFPVYIIALIGLLATYHKTPINELCILQADTLAIASKLLTLTDAEMIMGEQVKLTGNTFIKKGDTLEYKCDYTAISQDVITSKTGKLYFMYEIYDGVAAAANAYSSIYQANRKHKGAEIVSGLGDEAYYHSDQTGFYFVLVRKDKKMFRLKLNKVTSHSSETAFKEVVRRIVDKL
jgi:hypothetical protein